jgi:hypothetical protein
LAASIPIDPVTAIVGEKATRSTCERPHGRFPRERSTRDPLNALAAITALGPFPPVRC